MHVKTVNLRDLSKWQSGDRGQRIDSSDIGEIYERAFLSAGKPAAVTDLRERFQVIKIRNLGEAGMNELIIRLAIFARDNVRGGS